MKKLILSVAAFAFATVLFAQKKVADVAKFETETINQGNLKLNSPKEVRFIITNISKDPLIIERANPTCGCTMGDYTKSPIAPGATGFVSAKFNAATPGHFNKTMSVKFAGIDELKNITISGDVLTPDEYDKWAATQPKSATDVAPAKVTANTKGVRPASKNKN